MSLVFFIGRVLFWVIAIWIVFYLVKKFFFKKKNKEIDYE